MPRRFFKRLSRQRHSLKERWFMRPFQAVLHHPEYWSLNRRSVTRAVALGMFCAFIPLPVQMPFAAVGAVLFRINVPVAIAGVFVTNPLTTVPIFYAAYWIGCFMLGQPSDRFSFEMSWQWVQSDLLPVWKPFLLGCFALGVGSALLSYVLLGSLWHLSLVRQYYERKREDRRKRKDRAKA
jgi:uncharacterized protein (DUF2062 family)